MYKTLYNTSLYGVLLVKIILTLKLNKMNNSNPWEMIKNHPEISKMYTSKEIDEMTFAELSELINLYNNIKNK